MALWQITVKITQTSNNIRIEKGMSVEVITSTSCSPISSTTGQKQIQDAFQRKYGIDIKKACTIGNNSLDVKKVK